MSESERRGPCGTDTQHLINLSGYLWAREMLGPSAAGKILDIASGTGYGADVLSAGAERVVACDDDLPALEESKANYSRNNIVFLQCRGENLPLRSGSFQAVVSLETVEHIPDDKGFISELRRVLAPGGLLAMTTPFRETHCDHPQNPHHVREYSVDSLKRIIEPYFDIQLILGRHPGAAMKAAENRMDHIRRFDFLSVRTLLPRSLRHRMADVWLKLFGETTLKELGAGDVRYTPDLSGAVSMALLARRRS